MHSDDEEYLLFITVLNQKIKIVLTQAHVDKRLFFLTPVKSAAS